MNRFLLAIGLIFSLVVVSVPSWSATSTTTATSQSIPMSPFEWILRHCTAAVGMGT